MNEIIIAALELVITTMQLSLTPDGMLSICVPLLDNEVACAVVDPTNLPVQEG